LTPDPSVPTGSPSDGSQGSGDDGAEDLALPVFWDEFFDAAILTVPFSFLYLLLDM
jgi:hypothetical protein